jgi:hypothetical protein
MRYRLGKYPKKSSIEHRCSMTSASNGTAGSSRRNGWRLTRAASVVDLSPPDLKSDRRASARVARAGFGESRFTPGYASFLRTSRRRTRLGREGSIRLSAQAVGSAGLVWASNGGKLVELQRNWQSSVEMSMRPKSVCPGPGVTSSRPPAALGPQESRKAVPRRPRP